MGGDTIFGKIIRKEIPAKIVLENDRVLAFRDINPQAPVHILIIPKRPIRDLAAAEPDDKEILGELLLTAAELARKEGLHEGGYRVVFNTGVHAGQTVLHLHAHLLGGRVMEWPPG
jgi:histidine triad (HIT) family protein